MNKGLTDSQIAVTKLARWMGYMNHTIASYFGINQGRIAEINLGQLGCDIPAAKKLPADFPPLTDVSRHGAGRCPPENPQPTLF